MFYNDPMLYGATLPYKDVNFQTPFVPQYFAPWQQWQQRFLPEYQKIPYTQYPIPQAFDFPKIPYGQFPQFVDFPKFPFAQFPNFLNYPLHQLPFQQLPYQQLPYQQLPYQQLPYQQLQTPWIPPTYGFGLNMPFYGYKPPFVV